MALTTVGVALVAHAAIADMPWAAAFTLGAVVAPTDALAATTIASRLGVPRRLVAIVEGESLLNDGSALVAYRFAVAAVVSGSFSAMEVGFRFVVERRRRRAGSGSASPTSSGRRAGRTEQRAGRDHDRAWYAPELTTAETRLKGDAFWRILSFLLNAALFVLTGLQLPTVLDGLQAAPGSRWPPPPCWWRWR